MGEQNFFDQLAECWDDRRDLNPSIIEDLVSRVAFQEGDRVLDVGCGTGVLVPFVKNVIGDNGLITSVDFSCKMIERAVAKHRKLTGARFVVADIMEFQSEYSFDKIVCLNFFPHIIDRPLFLKRMHTMLADNGCLVIMHDISRGTVNTIHGKCDEVKNDQLPAGSKLANQLSELGYHASDMVDNDEFYFIKASKK